mmetsp:Transcript_25819/g.83405  ORF Transcript_25819/g.83405 Transcript_25819/m.83405 type:complete len:206 (+) Transcript_25819:828-1445(+)
MPSPVPPQPCLPLAPGPRPPRRGSSAPLLGSGRRAAPPSVEVPRDAACREMRTKMGPARWSLYGNGWPPALAHRPYLRMGPSTLKTSWADTSAAPAGRREPRRHARAPSPLQTMQLHFPTASEPMSVATAWRAAALAWRHCLFDLRLKVLPHSNRSSRIRPRRKRVSPTPCLRQWGEYPEAKLRDRASPFSRRARTSSIARRIRR